MPGTYQRWHLFIVVVGLFEASVYAVATGRSIGPKGPGSVCSGIANPLSVNVWTGPAGSKGWTEYQSWGIARVSRIGKDLLPSLDSDGNPNFQYDITRF